MRRQVGCQARLDAQAHAWPEASGGNSLRSWRDTLLVCAFEQWRAEHWSIKTLKPLDDGAAEAWSIAAVHRLALERCAAGVFSLVALEH